MELESLIAGRRCAVSARVRPPARVPLAAAPPPFPLPLGARPHRLYAPHGPHRKFDKDSDQRLNRSEFGALYDLVRRQPQMNSAARRFHRFVHGAGLSAEVAMRRVGSAGAEELAVTLPQLLILVRQRR